MVDDKNLNQKRRTAKEVDINGCRQGEIPAPADAHQQNNDAQAQAKKG
jgi:hypothetical protein